MPSNVTLASETLGIVICENANGPAGGTPDCESHSHHEPDLTDRRLDRMKPWR